MSRPISSEYRPCSKCGRTSPEVIFYIRKHGGRSSWCNSCLNSTNSQKNRSKRVRLTVFLHYGNGALRCSCEGCTVTAEEFLTIDHINGDGRKHREEIGGAGQKLYYWLIRNDYPEGFRVLCYNCNCSRGHCGYCPHERVKVDSVET